MPSIQELRAEAVKECHKAVTLYHERDLQNADKAYREAFHLFEAIPEENHNEVDYYNLALICRDRAWIHYINKNYDDMTVQFSLAVAHFHRFTRFIPDDKCYDSKTVILLMTLKEEAKLLSTAIKTELPEHLADSFSLLADARAIVSQRNGNHLFADSDTGIKKEFTLFKPKVRFASEPVVIPNFSPGLK